MPAKKKLDDAQIDALMQEFRAKRVRVLDFCAEKGVPVPTFRRYLKEWEEKQREIRLAALPEKPLAWLPPEGLSGRSRDAATQDPVLTLMVDLADNLGPHTEQALQLTLCCGGLVVSGRLIGAQEYFAAMGEAILSGASDLLDKYRRAGETLEKLLPDTERLPERREEWDDFYEPDNYRDAPEFVHLAEVSILVSGSNATQVSFWRGRLCDVTSFWTE